MKAPAIFIDKDGTLICDVPYNTDPSLIHFNEGVGRGLALFHEAGFKLVVVSNQSGVAMGYFTYEELDKVSARINEMLEPLNVHIDRFYYCPHHPDGKVVPFSIACDCRKPAPGLIMQAALELNIDIERSWMIGDILNDVEAGNRAGCRTVLIENGNETEWIAGPERIPHYRSDNFYQAVVYILNNRN